MEKENKDNFFEFAILALAKLGISICDNHGNMKKIKQTFEEVREIIQSKTNKSN